ncbi:hypothetical protein A3850_011910 [Lewinella sp. 4G2]|nr:hypothetical protein A3850_011910 [Lewinella sp. 4G2]
MSLQSCSKYEPVTFASPYSSSEAIRQEVASDTGNIFRFEPAAKQYAFIGQEELAIAMWDSSRSALKRAYGWEDLDTFSTDQVMRDFPNTIPAKKVILEQSASHRFTILNEAHHNSQHRAFTHSLLEDLYDQGYRHLGAEALIVNEPAGFIDDPQQISTESGTYVQDPEFAEMLKHAVELGYKLFEYEANDTIYGADRERVQAENILRYAERFPNDKLVIHSGFGHLIESETNKYTEWPQMGRQLHLLGGVDPLTVDQERYHPASSPAFEQALYRSVRPQEAVILTNGAGEAFGTNGADLSVFHPPVGLTSPLNKFRIDRSIALDFPVLVHAFRDTDDLSVAIPFAVAEATSHEFSMSTALDKSSVIILQQADGISIRLMRSGYQALN